MAMIFYFVMFAISLLLAVIYAFMFHKHYDGAITIITVLVPVINLGFVLMGMSQTIQEAVIGLRFTYIGSFVLVASMFLIFNICEIPLKPWMRGLIVAITAAVASTALTIGHYDIFYSGEQTLGFAYGAAYIDNKSYGFMHTVYYVMIGIYYAITIAAIVYSFFKKKQVPITILILIVIAVSVAIIGFFCGRLITNKVEVLPATYNLGVIVYLVLAARLRLYDASDSVTDSLVEKGETGFISFDSKMRYLNSNETAKVMIPELNDLVVDHHNKWIDEYFLPWVKDFESNPDNNKHFITRDGKSYLVNIHRLDISHLWHSHRGYQFLISDDTANQQYIQLIKNYNSELEKEVEKKTENIVKMHEKLILGMATMVEGRDNSTGGHIKRTSDCVRILIDEMTKEGVSLGLSEAFCKNIIKAAPMHDLGKIAVDDAVLRKPGRFTPEEFEQMKKHAAEGARIVSKILEGTDDKEFAKIAINVAHYHHERWDGSGYPEGLKGEEIPLEARIMAIADVYDALVSKRVYKESMSFEAADQIIMEGMGKHFDKKLEPYYVAARPRLEEYYKSIEQ